MEHAQHRTQYTDRAFEEIDVSVDVEREAGGDVLSNLGVVCDVTNAQVKKTGI